MVRIKALVMVMVIILPFKVSGQGLDQKINDEFMPIAQAWEDLVFTEILLGHSQVPLILIVLLISAAFFTLYFGFINLRRFLLAIQVVRGKYDHLEKSSNHSKDNHEVRRINGDIVDTIKNEGHHGEVSHFQALATAVSGTVGLGNIAMVAVAISIGGPGATFWMILAGLLGMSTKFVECTLGVKYRDIDGQGRVYGGPMYYLSKGMSHSGWGKTGKFLAVLFAIICVGASLGGGNAFQSNQAAAQLAQQLDLGGQASGTLIGLCLAALVGIVIIGGIKRIAQVTGKIVPLMAGLYLIAALFIIFSNLSAVDDIFQLIFTEAFTPRATISGGAIGVVIQGFRRAAFSNEAGAGSAAIAHSAVATKFPASEGLVGLLEPFIDTVIVCTITAMVIISFNMNAVFTYGSVVDNQVILNESGELIGGVNLTSMAFEWAIPGSSLFLTLAVVLFAFSTMLSWSYYGLQAWKYLFGRNAHSDLIYKLLFLTFTVLGAAITMDAVIKFSDAMILALVFPNMIGLLFLFPQVKVELNKYLMAIRKIQTRDNY